MKALISLLLCLTLLCGCAAPAQVSSFLPAELMQRAQSGSIAALAQDSIVLKLFPLESSSALDLAVKAEADDVARGLLGEELSGVQDALPALSLVLQGAQKGLVGEALPEDAADRVQLFQSVLPLVCSYFPDSLSTIKDGRLFLSRELLSAWAESFSLDAEAAAKGLDYDEKNDGWLLDAPKDAQALDLTLLTALQGPQEDSVQLDLLAEQADESWRALVTLEKDAQTGALRLSDYAPLEEDVSPFSYVDTDLALTEEQEYPALELALKTGSGLIAEESEQGLCLTPTLPGTVAVGEARENSRAALYIRKSPEGRYHIKDSAYASAAAAQQGYAEQGMEVVDLAVHSCTFLGSNDAYVLRYTVLDAQGAPAQSVEHYIVEAGNGEQYHFVYVFESGYTDVEREMLYKASQTVRFNR